MVVAATSSRSCSNLRNAATALLLPLPSLIFLLYFFYLLPSSASSASSASPPSSSLSIIRRWCLDHPLLLANALFFLNVDCLFWVIALLHSTHWMIDLYWTLIPVMLLHYYAAHPLAHYDACRSRLAMALTWAWSIRLTHSYFRREDWQWGAREDWRFADMRLRYANHWWWISFFMVYLSQQVLLIGVCLPLYAVHFYEKSLNVWDFVAAIICCSGIAIAFQADTQLHTFMKSNSKRLELGKPVVPTLDHGLWRFSRHPNYFGEQLWWWGLAIFGWNVGQGWTVVGAVINSLCLFYVTKLVEERIMKNEGRAETYRLYQKTTSLWLPWFKSTPKGGKHKSS